MSHIIVSRYKYKHYLSQYFLTVNEYPGSIIFQKGSSYTIFYKGFIFLLSFKMVRSYVFGNFFPFTLRTKGMLLSSCVKGMEETGIGKKKTIWEE